MSSQKSKASQRLNISRINRSQLNESFKSSTSSLNSLSGRANRTISSSSSSSTTASATSKQKLTTKLDTLYNKYLMACLKKRILKENFKQKEIACNDQLHIYKTQLVNAQMKANDLKTEIHELKAQKQLLINVNKLKEIIDMNIKALNEDDVLTHVDVLINLLDTQANKLYLKNVDPIKDERQYKQLEEVIAKFVTVLSKMKENAGSIGKLKELREAVEAMKKKQLEAEKMGDELERLEDLVIKTTLKEASDKLA